MYGGGNDSIFGGMWKLILNGYRYNIENRGCGENGD